MTLLPFRRRAPSPPVNVRLLLADDTEIPVSCEHIGKIGGHHTWRVIRPEHPGPFTGMAIDEVPPGTAIEFPMSPKGRPG